MKTVGTITLDTAFYTNEYAENPDVTYLSFSQAELDRIEYLLKLAEKENITISLDFDAQDYKILGEKEGQLDDCNFRPGFECLKLYSNGVIYYYAQNSYDSTIQFESNGFTLTDIKK